MNLNIGREIRINENFVTTLESDFPEGKEKDSVPIVQKNVVTTDKFLSKFQKYFENKYSPNKLEDVFPSNCRYMEKSGGRTLVIIEEAPMIRTIKVQMELKGEVDLLRKLGKLEEYGYTKEMCKEYSAYKIHTLTLAFPFTVFFFVVDHYNKLLGGQIYFRNSRMVGINDYLFSTPLLNVSSSQYICFGDINNHDFPTLNKCIENVVSYYWSNIFTTDYMYGYYDYLKDSVLNSFLAWQGLTSIDPMFIYKVNWLKYPKCVKEVKDEIARKYFAPQSLAPSSTKDQSFRNILSIITDPIESEKIVKNKKSKENKKETLLYDYTSGIELEPGFLCHTGDYFILPNGKKMMVDSFLGFKGSKQAERIRVVNQNGKGLLLLNNHTIRKLILMGIKRLTEEPKAYLKNGVEVKPGDIIKLNFNGYPLYQRIKNLIKTPENNILARTSSAFYILDNIEGEIFNVKIPTINGQEIKEEEKYFYLRHFQYYTEKFHICSPIKYNNIDISESGNIILKFSSDRESFSIKEEKLNSHVFKEADVVNIPEIFGEFRRLIYPTRRVSSSNILNVRVVATESDYYSVSEEITHMSPQTNQDKKKVCDNIMKDGNFSLFYKDLPNNTLSFNVGDKVVVANWLDPNDMLTIKTITGIINNGNSTISFNLQDKNNNTSTYTYLNLERNVLNIGCVRKIVNNIGDYSTGMKIKAKEANIYGFPKKDVNIIIGFLIDCFEPQVLCSNCLTIKLSDLSKFDIIPYGSKQWSKHQHEEINISKIKPQPGDILSGNVNLSYKPFLNDNGWLVSSRSGSLYFKDIYNTNNNPLNDSYKSYLNFETFLSPRININTITKTIKYIPGHYTPHGDKIIYKNPSVETTSYIPNEE